MICTLMTLVEFFFFKQKTAYEMRISDWSSDVCSSDLSVRPRRRAARRWAAGSGTACGPAARCAVAAWSAGPSSGCRARSLRPARARSGPGRSEEHTSELQSLMRISYAVFCLNKKNETTKHNKHHLQSQQLPPNTL